MASPSDKVKFLLRVEGDILSTLRELATAKEISLSQLLRDILRSYVDRLTIRVPVLEYRTGSLSTGSTCTVSLTVLYKYYRTFEN